MRDYFVYIFSNNSQVLYIGVTRDLDGRLFEHTKTACRLVLLRVIISTGSSFTKHTRRRVRRLPAKSN